MCACLAVKKSEIRCRQETLLVLIVTVKAVTRSLKVESCVVTKREIFALHPALVLTAESQWGFFFES